MITWGVLLPFVIVSLGAVLAIHRHQPQHAAAADMVTVGDLVKRAETGTGGGRHRLLEPITICRDLADDIAAEQTRILPLPPEVWAADPHEMARHPLVLHRVLAGVRRL